MAYSRENKLRLICEIQDITLKEKAQGKTQKWIYENLIYPRFLVSPATYNNYLGTNARLELKQLLESKKGSEQPTLNLFETS